MRRWFFTLVVLAGLTALAACAAKETAPVAPAAPAPPAPEVAPAWQEQWEQVLAAAKREGKVVVAGPVGDLREALTKSFEKKYGITVEYLGHRGPEFVERLRAERGAGQYLWDLRVGGVSTAILDLKPMGFLDSLEPALILPEVKDPKNWHDGALPFLDKERTVLAMTRYDTEALSINTTLVKPGEFRSFKDLLDPKWKGKIVLHDPTVPGSGDAKLFFYYMHKDLGEGFIRALAKQEVAVIRDYAQIAQWLATGRYAIGVGAGSTDIEPLRRAGAPVDYVSAKQMKEGGSRNVGVGGLSLFSKAPHPNAAKVFINWLLSKEGSSEFGVAGGYAMARVDVSTAHLQPWQIPAPDAFPMEGEEQARKREEARKLFREIFGGR